MWDTWGITGFTGCQERVMAYMRLDAFQLAAQCGPDVAGLGVAAVYMLQAGITSGEACGLLTLSGVYTICSWDGCKQPHQYRDALPAAVLCC